MQVLPERHRRVPAQAAAAAVAGLSRQSGRGGNGVRSAAAASTGSGSRGDAGGGHAAGELRLELRLKLQNPRAAARHLDTWAADAAAMKVEGVRVGSRDETRYNLWTGG